MNFFVCVYIVLKEYSKEYMQKLYELDDIAENYDLIIE